MRRSLPHETSATPLPSVCACLAVASVSSSPCVAGQSVDTQQSLLLRFKPIEALQENWFGVHPLQTLPLVSLRLSVIVLSVWSGQGQDGCGCCICPRQQAKASAVAAPDLTLKRPPPDFTAGDVVSWSDQGQDGCGCCICPRQQAKASVVATPDPDPQTPST